LKRELRYLLKLRLDFFIAYFHEGQENLDYKNQLQEIILRDGKTGYLSKNTFDSILKISIDQITDEKLLFETITKIEEDLYLQISKIQDEISFYRRFSNYNPLKRFVGFTLLSLQYIISLSLVISILFFLIYIFLETNNYFRVGTIVASLPGLYFIDKWLRK
jgi:hypothetical protein